MKKKVFVACLGLLLFLLIFLPVSKSQFGIRINLTKSLPYKIFLSKPVSKIVRGAYVSLEHPLISIPVAKQIVGISGDKVTIENDHIVLNGQKLGKILKCSKSGKEYTPISEIKIEEGYVFVYAPHEESFDSRYQEFGVIPITYLKEDLCPIY